MGSLHGFEIDCDRELRRVSPTTGSLGTVRVRAASESPLDQGCELLRLITDAEGTPVFALGRNDGRLVSWHASGGSFLIDGAAGRIAYRPEDGTVEGDAARWEHRLGSNALPLLAGERGALPLHASAAAVGGRAVVICGVTGRGKSTLAATLVARGHEAIAEDGVVVGFDRDEPIAWPGLAGAMITGETAAAVGIAETVGRADARGRVFVEAPRAVTGPAPVAGVAILMERAGERVQLVRPEPPRAHRELLAHVICAERRGPVAFASAARLVERAPVTLLTVPDSIEELGRAAEALESLPELD
ncbi:MAG: hypothetical protein ACRDL6_01250 [Solirubrobacterales bacterium]